MDISQQIAKGEEYSVLQSFINDESDLHTTISEFTKPLSHALDNSSSVSEDELNDMLITAWDSVLLLASQTPHDSPKQEKLVHFLQSLVQQPPVEHPQTKKPLEVGHAGRVWTDLPIFSRQVRECWNFPSHEDVDDAIKHKWINANAFVARLTGAAWAMENQSTQTTNAKANTEALSFPLIGLWSLRAAFEEDMTDGNVGEASVCAGAVWMIYAQAPLREWCRQEKAFDGKLGSPGGQYPKREWKGYCMNRRVEWAGHLKNWDGVLTGDFKELVHAAHHAMKDG